MNEEWETCLYELIDEDYDIEDLVGVCKTARRNGFCAGVEWLKSMFPMMWFPPLQYAGRPYGKHSIRWRRNYCLNY